MLFASFVAKKLSAIPLRGDDDDIRHGNRAVAVQVVPAVENRLGRGFAPMRGQRLHIHDVGDAVAGQVALRVHTLN